MPALTPLLIPVFVCVKNILLRNVVLRCSRHVETRLASGEFQGSAQTHSC